MDVDRNSIIKALRKLKRDKSPGPNGLHPRVIKEVAEELVEPLWMIFNRSLRDGQVPREWKIANITAIFKKGNRYDASSYRPVLDKWTQVIDEGGAVDVAYCDLKKAFDTVAHKRLIEKVKRYNITWELLGWIESFISERKQCVVVQGEKSDMKNKLSRVPQGSVLGPLLFVTWNDLEEVVENSNMFLYADDTEIFKEIRKLEECEALQEDLEKMENWSGKWLYKFHSQKCSYMRIGNVDVQNFKYRMSKELKEVEVEKDLGVTIDRQLNFEKHFAEKVNKANSIVGHVI
ncbi:hypothetical protein Pmani_013373 [Petrolisthes manimaculis]|uniref:Reverse transcriptase domain-containing protein n=1 Tax=Petrolisthes manimaculis TaxID=1843537 RepID=A0AAE1PYS5_9EUCA|nr:hypothetical protein Pmani_013373 [Petrolisthes manimaculis]